MTTKDKSQRLAMLIIGFAMFAVMCIGIAALASKSADAGELIPVASLSACPEDCRNMTVYSIDGIYRPNDCPRYDLTFFFSQGRGFVKAACEFVHEPPLVDLLDIEELTRGYELMPGFVRVQDKDWHFYWPECRFSSSSKSESDGFNVVVFCSTLPETCDLETEGCQPVFPPADVGLRK